MKANQSRLRLRALLESDGCTNCPSVFDPVSARIAEKLGFGMGIIGGSVASFGVVGAPDVNVMTLSEFTEQVRRICRASALPLIADADHGYGNALCAMRAVEEIEAAGAAAITIEDTRIPGPFGCVDMQLVETAEMEGKLRAALAARDDTAFMIIARTQLLGSDRLEECVGRLVAYEKTGVDGLCVTGVTAPAQLERLMTVAKKPMFIIAYAGSELGSSAALERFGVRACLHGHFAWQAAVQATYATLKALREDMSPSQLGGMPTTELMNEVSLQRSYAERAQAFLL